MPFTIANTVTFEEEIKKSRFQAKIGRAHV